MHTAYNTKDEFEKGMRPPGAVVVLRWACTALCVAVLLLFCWLWVLACGRTDACCAVQSTDDALSMEGGDSWFLLGVFASVCALCSVGLRHAGASVLHEVLGLHLALSGFAVFFGATIAIRAQSASESCTGLENTSWLVLLWQLTLLASYAVHVALIVLRTVPLPPKKDSSATTNQTSFAGRPWRIAPGWR